MCSIEDYDRNNPTGNDDKSISGDRPFPTDSTEHFSLLLELTPNFIYSSIKLFKTNYLH